MLIVIARYVVKQINEHYYYTCCFKAAAGFYKEKKLKPILKFKNGDRMLYFGSL